ncbi:MAG: hypothetical protein EBX39_13095 [Actinobacteria bacterium]|nr:hypothetical protein [Actinomycetota bacterium]
MMRLALPPVALIQMHAISMSLQVAIMEVVSSPDAQMHCLVITTLLRVATTALVCSWMIVVFAEERESLVAQM